MILINLLVVKQHYQLKLPSLLLVNFENYLLQEEM